ncbi:EAL domain-containing protein [Eubacterium aggregans]|uniref:EAL domain-containing protein n=1 Tax=Eubacterium aggregans TaxID=81409 RepID=UPI003F3D70E1
MTHNYNFIDDLEHGLMNDEFVIYYQPQIDYKSGGLIGAEALVRWNHPIMGMNGNGFSGRFCSII